jgi:hypothetical protein
MDLEAFDGGRDRSKQSDAGVIGVSDLHTCREKVRRTLLGMVATDVPEKWAAIVGTYVDEGVKAARKAARPWLLHDVDLTVKLPNGLEVPGHADEIDTQEGSVTDYKTKDKLSLVRRLGADEHDRAQRHLYYLGAHQQGLVPAEGIVRNVWIDRSGSDSHPHVEQEPFSMDVVLAAQAWYEDAIYAAKHGEDAMKDWPRSMCSRFCEFFTACRGSEPVDEEYLTGHRAAILAELVAAKTTEKQAAALKDAARNELLGVTGRSDTHWVRSTVTNGKTASTRLDAGLIEEGAA